jgi:pimeloyl-ACP methyl ester carboxylesterase
MTTAPPIHHHREGRGAPLLLLHGIGHHWQAYAPVLGDLVRDFDVLACDSPGFGRSPALPSGSRCDVAAYADAFAAWIGEQGLDRPHVVGNSMGGAIALELARSGVVRSATAISPAGFWTAAERRYCQATLGALAGLPRALRPAVVAAAGSPVGRTALGAQLFARPWKVPAEEFRATLRDGWAAPAFGPALRAFDDYVFARGDELAGTPTSVLWGTRDGLLPYTLQAPRAVSALPAARHVPLPGLGHVPFTDDPGMCAAAIRRGVAAGDG